MTEPVTIRLNEIPDNFPRWLPRKGAKLYINDTLVEVVDVVGDEYSPNPTIKIRRVDA